MPARRRPHSSSAGSARRSSSTCRAIRKRSPTELPAIREHGYEIARVQPVDMFPHTTHIETVVTLHARPTQGKRRKCDAANVPKAREMSA